MKEIQPGSRAGWVAIGGLAAIVVALLIANQNVPIPVIELLWKSVLFLGVVCTVVGAIRWMMANQNDNVSRMVNSSQRGDDEGRQSAGPPAVPQSSGCARFFLGLVLIILALGGLFVVYFYIAFSFDFFSGPKPLSPAFQMTAGLAAVVCVVMFCCGVYQLFRARFGNRSNERGDGPSERNGTN